MRLRGLVLCAVMSLHLFLGALLLSTSKPSLTTIELPTITGVLIAPPKAEVPAPPPARPPVPLVEAPPAVVQKPVVPVKKLPPSKTAIQQSAATSPPSVAAPAQASVAQASAAPVIPPRVDASQLNNPAPTYPAVSRRLREQGVVLLALWIKADGTVGEISIKRSSGFKRLDDTAIQAVKRWRYLPAKRGDIAIDYGYIQPIEFSLAH